MMNKFKIILLVALMTLLSSCVITRFRQVEDNVLGIQNRLIKLEGTLQNKSETQTKESRQQVGSLHTDLEKMNVEIQRLKGEVEALRIGVREGELPGTDDNTDSIAKRLNNVITRLDTVESQNKDIATSIQKVVDSDSSASSKSSSSNKDSLENLTQLKTAFDKKKYASVAEDAKQVLKNTKAKKDKSEVIYLHAESLFKLGRIDDSALIFNELIETNPSQSYMVKAKMRLGDCFRFLGDTSTAKLYYQEVVSTYPKAEEATRAKERLKGMDEKDASKKPKPKTTKMSRRPAKKANKANRG